MILFNLPLNSVVVGSLSTPSTRPEPSNSRVVNINILAASGPQNNQETERQIPSSVLQLLRSLFPGGEIHVEDSSVQGIAAGSTSDHAATSTGAAQVPEAQPNVSEEGIFLSNMLREIMPVISQQVGSEEGIPSEDHMAQDSSTQVCIVCFPYSIFICLITFAIRSTSTTKASLAHCECFITFDTHVGNILFERFQFLYTLLKSLWVSLSPELLNRYNISKNSGEIMQENFLIIVFFSLLNHRMSNCEN